MYKKFSLLFNMIHESLISLSEMKMKDLLTICIVCMIVADLNRNGQKYLVLGTYLVVSNIEVI